MSYTVTNFKTKKLLKEAVAAWKANLDIHDNSIYPDKDNPVRCYNPGAGLDLSDYTGVVYLEGPHYPEAHKWYARAELKDGVVVKVT